ncbi:hypothetical protein CBER1_10819 [Cercospora berteroae]|uniref:non-specific serine/threonine protein kinase n=1 Tax=Cercospora berteroae TaxID=357750 RepID=A0A2S6CM55_9PEZI|nr:hypothetical protein CBER1_10819 [Cercospora berteroae]
MQRRKKGQKLVGAEIYICKEYPLAGGNWTRANGPRYVFGERNILKALQGLNHPNIIDYVDFFYEHNSQIAKLYTEYCRFGDLEQALQNRKGSSKLDTRESVLVLYQIACSLLYLHHGVYHTDDTLKVVSLPDAAQDGRTRDSWVKILHRDIKPANGKDHIRVKLGDFGIAKTEADDTATHIGTPDYYAPEQTWGFKGPGRRRTTFKSDVYALGGKHVPIQGLQT